MSTGVRPFSAFCVSGGSGAQAALEHGLAPTRWAHRGAAALASPSISGPPGRAPPPSAPVRSLCPLRRAGRPGRRAAAPGEGDRAHRRHRRLHPPSSRGPTSPGARRGSSVPVVSGGGTPALLTAQHFPALMEHRAGMCDYNDSAVVSTGTATWDTCAMRVRATVVSLPTPRCHPRRRLQGADLRWAPRGVEEILGHRDPRMAARPRPLSPQHLRDAIRALEAPPRTPAS
jgi:hypothetical protein